VFQYHSRRNHTRQFRLSCFIGAGRRQPQHFSNFFRLNFISSKNPNADGVVGGEPASHHKDLGSVPGSGVVICDLVDALCIALPLRVCAVSLQYLKPNGEGVNMRIRPSALGHITSHSRVTEILKVVRIMRLIDKKKIGK
jgi:hypothetical protein